MVTSCFCSLSTFAFSFLWSLTSPPPLTRRADATARQDQRKKLSFVYLLFSHPPPLFKKKGSEYFHDCKFLSLKKTAAHFLGKQKLIYFTSCNVCFALAYLCKKRNPQKTAPWGKKQRGYGSQKKDLIMSASKPPLRKKKPHPACIN